MDSLYLGYIHARNRLVIRINSGCLGWSVNRGWGVSVLVDDYPGANVLPSRRQGVFWLISYFVMQVNRRILTLWRVQVGYMYFFCCMIATTNVIPSVHKSINCVLFVCIFFVCFLLLVLFFFFFFSSSISPSFATSCSSSSSSPFFYFCVVVPCAYEYVVTTRMTQLYAVEKNNYGRSCFVFTTVSAMYMSTHA